MTKNRSVFGSRSCLSLLGILLAVATGCATETEAPDPETTDTSTSELRIGGGLGAEGDACTVRTNPDGTTVPGTEKGLECCSTATPTDCVVILKPFPKAFAWR